MKVSLHEAKTHLSGLIEAVERGEEVVVSRRNKVVAKIVPVTGEKPRRIGVLSGRPFRMGAAFDTPLISESLGDAFGVPES